MPALDRHVVGRLGAVLHVVRESRALKARQANRHEADGCPIHMMAQPKQCVRSAYILPWCSGAVVRRMRLRFRTVVNTSAGTILEETSENIHETGSSKSNSNLVEPQLCVRAHTYGHDAAVAIRARSAPQSLL